MATTTPTHGNPAYDDPTDGHHHHMTTATPIEGGLFYLLITTAPI